MVQSARVMTSLLLPSLPNVNTLDDIVSSKTLLGERSHRETALSASPWQRHVLGTTGWVLWLPAVIHGISQGNLPLTFFGLPLFLLSLFFSLVKLVCPQCNHAVRTIGNPRTHCIQYGAAYEVAKPTQVGHSVVTPGESERQDVLTVNAANGTLPLLNFRLVNLLDMS